MKTKLLAKPISNFPTAWTIATSAEEFHQLQATHVDVGYHDRWGINSTIDGVTHFFDRFIVVCLPLDVSTAVLVHEAVHVFNAMMRDAGEEAPGEEITAYGIQFIFETMQDEINQRRAKAKTNEAK